MQIENIKTITELSQLDGRVYVHLLTETLAVQFMRQAEEEGFSFADGVKPTKRTAATIMAVNPNHTINYIGAVGHIAFGAGAKTIGGRQLFRMSYLGNHIASYEGIA